MLFSRRQELVQRGKPKYPDRDVEEVSTLRVGRLRSINLMFGRGRVLLSHAIRCVLLTCEKLLNWYRWF